MSDLEKCQHIDFDEYFERCSDCNTTLDDMPQEIQNAFNEQFEEE